MYCKGILVYKGIEKREGGTFKNAQGQDINYDSSYVIKVDEIKDNSPTERKFKFSQNNKTLFSKFNDIEMYTRVSITFDVVISTNSCKLVPVDVQVDFTEEQEEN